MKIPAVDPKFRVEWMLRTNNIVKFDKYVIFFSNQYTIVLSVAININKGVEVFNFFFTKLLHQLQFCNITHPTAILPCGKKIFDEVVGNSIEIRKMSKTNTLFSYFNKKPNLNSSDQNGNTPKKDLPRKSCRNKNGIVSPNHEPEKRKQPSTMSTLTIICSFWFR